MSERNDNRLPAGLIWLLIYHWIIVLIGLGYLVAAVVILFEATTDRDYVAVLGAALSVLVLTCWTTAMSYAAVGMMRKRPRGLLVGMICHLILAILSNVGLGTFCCMGVLSWPSRSHGWADLLLLFALMWSPFALFSSWGFFYLRRLRKDLLA